ncbi:MAG: hypothetical protein ACFFB3_08870 [Candidatus Hodarchaeota archaeon]
MSNPPEKDAIPQREGLTIVKFLTPLPCYKAVKVMNPKEYFQEVAELPYEQAKTNVSETFYKIYEMSEEKRADFMTELTIALSETSEETQSKVIRARIEVLAEASEEMRSAIMAAWMKVAPRVPKAIRENEEKRVKQVVPTLSAPAKRMLQEIGQRMQS